MERFHYSGQDASKEVWTAEDIESFLLRLAFSRQPLIEEYGSDFMKYISLNRLQEFKRRVTRDPLYIRAGGYGKSQELPQSSRLPTRRIDFGPRWKGEIEAILAGTNSDKYEIAIFVVYNSQTEILEFRRGPISGRGQIDATKSIAQTEIAGQTPIVALGHTHPLPQYVDKSSLHHYGYPSSTSFFAPRDLDNIIRARITPLHFVISGNRMSVGITTWETRRGDIEEEFLKTQMGIPENALEVETFRDALRRASYYLFKAPPGPPDNFDMFEWNVEIAKDYRFALYRGSIDTVERVA